MMAIKGVVEMSARTPRVESALVRNESPRAPPFLAPDQWPSLVVSSFLLPLLAYVGCLGGSPMDRR